MMNSVKIGISIVVGNWNLCLLRLKTIPEKLSDGERKGLEMKFLLYDTETTALDTKKCGLHQLSGLIIEYYDLEFKNL